jgi:hypothetical protein
MPRTASVDFSDEVSERMRRISRIDSMEGESAYHNGVARPCVIPSIREGSSRPLLGPERPRYSENPSLALGMTVPRCRSLRPVTGINPADQPHPFAQSSEMVG